MRLIGVIDLKDGKAVHARGGRRELYAPVRQSAGVVVNGDPMALARLYAGTLGLSEIYVADLDAIARAGRPAAFTKAMAPKDGQPQQDPAHPILANLVACGASIWIDAGIASADAARRAAGVGAQTLVVGLETLASFEGLADICAHTTRPVAFSLDLRGGTPMSAALAAHPPEAIARLAVEAGAHMIIVLDVARVGLAEGPDFDLLRRIRSVVPGTLLFAGGGVRGIDDLRQLAGIGCAGALVATAVHEGRLTAADVAAMRSHAGPADDTAG